MGKGGHREITGKKREPFSSCKRNYRRQEITREVSKQEVKKARRIK